MSKFSSFINKATQLTKLPMTKLREFLVSTRQPELEAALDTKNPQVIETELDVDKDTAKRIVDDLNKMDEPPKEVKVKLEHYVMRQYKAEMFFCDEDTILRANLVHANNYTDIMAALTQWQNWANAHVKLPFNITAVPEYQSQPQSIMSDIIGVKYDGQPTNKVAIVDHQIDVPMWPKEVFDQIVPDPMVQKVIRKNIEDIKALYVLRLIYSGLIYNHNHMLFFTSAPSQLKKGSAYLMRKEEMAQYNKVWWGGLSAEKLNLKGGMVTTKFLQQFRALLCTSAAPSSKVLGFPMTLDQAICVKEITTQLSYPNVWNLDANYNLLKKAMNDIDFSPFDGEVMLDASVFGNVCLQLRAFSCKGLGVSFNFKQWCLEHGYPFIVETIDGKRVDVVKEGKTIILNDTVWKLAKYYDSWDQFVETMRELGLMEFYICGIDEEETRNKALSRQTLQTLFTLSDPEIEKLAKKALTKLERMQTLEGVYEELSEAGTPWEERTKLAKLVAVYPEIMVMDEIQQQAKERYESAFNKIMYGKLPIQGEFHYASGDLGAYCDCLFGGHKLSDKGIGILRPYQVACNQHYKGDDSKVSLARYPHAFFEWINCDVIKSRWFNTHAIYFSVYDLCYRILQMDVDGDHVLVVNNKIIYNAIEKIRNVYKLPVLVYDPTNGGKKEIPTDKYQYSKMITECIMSCLKTNKVGSYSNLITACWSFVNPHMQPDDDELISRLEDAAVIACGINHAVDSQKTGSLNELDYNFVQQYKVKPYSQRYKDCGPDCPSDALTWNDATMAQGEGSVERMERIVNLYAPHHMNLDTTSLEPDWHMMRNDQWEHRKMLRSCLSKRVMDLLNQYSRVEIRLDGAGKLALEQLTIGLMAANGAFWADYHREERDGIEKSVTIETRESLVREIYLSFMKSGENLKKRNMENASDIDILRWVSNMLVTIFWGNKSTCDASPETMRKTRKFIIDNFGDIMADAVLENYSRGLMPEPDRDAFIIKEDIPEDPNVIYEEAPAAEFDVMCPGIECEIGW